MAEYTDFTERMKRGDTHIFRFTVKKRDAETDVLTVQNITTWPKFWLMAKRRVRDLDIDAVLALTDVSAAAGITRIDQINGLCEVKITPVMLAGLTPRRRDLELLTEIQGQDGPGNIYTLSSGLIIIEGDIQRGDT